MTRSGSRSGPDDRQGGSGRSSWDTDAPNRRNPALGASRSRGDQRRDGRREDRSRGGSHARPPSGRTTHRYDDGLHDDGLYDDRWQGGGPWGAEVPNTWEGAERWSGTDEWDDQPAQSREVGAAAAQAARGGTSSVRSKKKAAKPPLSVRVRYLFTAEAWQPAVLRTWPSALRLLLVAALLGGCGGLGLFATRDQVGAQSGLTTGSSPLQQIKAGPGVTPPPLYVTWTPYPTQPTTPSPTTAPKPSPTTNPVQLQANLLPPQAQCASPVAPLPQVTLVLNNSQSATAITWTLTTQTEPGTAQHWAQAVPPGPQLLAAGQIARITLIPAADLCRQVTTTGSAEQLLAQIIVTPGGETINQYFTVVPPIGIGPTPSPSPGGTPSPTPSPSATGTKVPGGA